MAAEVAGDDGGERRQFVQIGEEVVLRTESVEHGVATEEADHLVHVREAGGGQQHLVARFEGLETARRTAARMEYRWQEEP